MILLISFVFFAALSCLRLNICTFRRVIQSICKCIYRRVSIECNFTHKQQKNPLLYVFLLFLYIFSLSSFRHHSHFDVTLICVWPKRSKKRTRHVIQLLYERSATWTEKKLEQKCLCLCQTVYVVVVFSARFLATLDILNSCLWYVCFLVDAFYKFLFCIFDLLSKPDSDSSHFTDKKCWFRKVRFDLIDFFLTLKQLKAEIIHSTT